MSLKSIISCAALLLLSASAFDQADRRDVRAGNRKFRKGDYKAAEIDYRKAVVKDSTSMAGSYNLSNDLYRQEGFEDAGKAMEAAARGAANVSAWPDAAPKQLRKSVDSASDVFYNSGDIALQQKDYAAAVEAFKQALLRRPDDLDAKENYIYAKLMLQNQQNGGGGGGQNNQDRFRAAQGDKDISPAGPADAAGHSGKGERDPGQGEQGEGGGAQVPPEREELVRHEETSHHIRVAGGIHGRLCAEFHQGPGTERGGRGRAVQYFLHHRR